MAEEKSKTEPAEKPDMETTAGRIADLEQRRARLRMGGGAAALAGRAIAQTWRPFWSVMVYMAMLGAAVRFVHFALFEATLLSPPHCRW